MKRVLLAAILWPTLAWGFSSQEAMTKRPDLFHPQTGMRIDRHRAPTPDDVPGAVAIHADAAAALRDAGAVLIDVMGARRSSFDPIDGAWLIGEPRDSIPGAVWLPEVGRGGPEPDIERYFRENLDRLTDGDKTRPVVLFCIADCWMAWNAARRAAAWGYGAVYWLREGTDGWAETGRPLARATPVPVRME